MTDGLKILFFPTQTLLGAPMSEVSGKVRWRPIGCSNLGFRCNLSASRSELLLGAKRWLAGHRSGGCRLHPSEAEDYSQARDPPWGPDECWHRLQAGSSPSRSVARHIAVGRGGHFHENGRCMRAGSPSLPMSSQEAAAISEAHIHRPVCVQNSFPAKWPSNAFLAKSKSQANRK